MKSTNAELMQRVSLVYQMLLRGYTRSDIIQYVSKETNWNVSDRMIDTYMKKAREDLGDVTEEEKQAALGSALKRLDMLYRKALKKDDLKTCLAVQREINDLFHLKDEEQKSDNVINITFSNGEEQFL